MSNLSPQECQVPIDFELFKILQKAAEANSVSVRHYVEQLIQKAMTSSSTIENVTPSVHQLVTNAEQESEKGETLRFDNSEEMHRWIESLWNIIQ